MSLNTGDAAPDFTLPNQDGEPVSLRVAARQDGRALLLSQGGYARMHHAGVWHP